MKKLMLSAICALAVLCLAGCAKSIPEESTLSVDKSGKITYTLVEDFEKNFYDAEELQGEIEADVAKYNKKFDTEHLKLELFNVEDGKATMQMVFDEAKYYADYSKLTFFSGNVAEAREAGYDLDGEFLDAEGALTDLTQVPNVDKAKVLILEEAMKVEVPGKILCVTPPSNVAFTGKGEVTIGEVQQTCIVYE